MQKKIENVNPRSYHRLEGSNDIRTLRNDQSCFHSFCFGASDATPNDLFSARIPSDQSRTLENLKVNAKCVLFTVKILHKLLFFFVKKPNPTP